MKRIVLLTFSLLILTLTQTAFAQRKGLNFNQDAYKSVPLADEVKLGYTDNDLPKAVSYKQYAPYAGNQGDYGTCVGWSSSYGALSIENAIQAGMTDRQQITFSAFCPYYVYNQFKEESDLSCQSGGLFEDALEILYEKGAKKYYLPEFTCNSDYEDFSLENAGAYKINDYYRLFDWSESELEKALGTKSTRVSNIKKALANGHPVLIGAYVPGSFDYLIGKDLWTPTQDEKDNFNTQPGHAMVIVGYDDKKYGGAFEIMNSWGKDWGNEGFIWAKYEDVDLFGHTAFYMELPYKYYPSSGCQLGDCTNNYSRYKWANGEIYEGELKNGLFEGEGIYFWVNGDSYAGEWKGGLKQGKGVQLYADGSTTDGYWKDDLYYGETSPDPDNTDDIVEDVINYLDQVEEEEKEETLTAGCISGDCNDGFGKYIYSDGDTYEGNFKSTYRDGFGKYVYIEGDIYEGIWDMSVRTGLGYYKWPSGNEYIGYWQDNQQHGLGTKYYTDGSSEAGQWENGVYKADDASFGYSNSKATETLQSDQKAGTVFKRSENKMMPATQHNQIPMKQSGFNSIPKSGLGLPMEDPYLKIANTVLKDILRGIGKTDLNNPPVNIINSATDVAYTNKDKGIHISTKLIDVCRSFGKDSLSALSIIMAHELGHYFKDHFFCRDFGFAYSKTEWADSLTGQFKDLYNSGYFETQADEFGLFYSFISGYNPFDVADKVIAKIYEQFSLPDEMTGYPPKDFRIKQIGLAAENVKNLIPLFEVGNLMSVLSTGKLGGLETDLIENANLCYEHIIDQKITTSEMYNNLGVNYINLALSLVDDQAFPYALPLEIDFNSRLYSTPGGGGTKGNLGYGENELQIVESLNQAKAYFELAIKLDENYIPGYNNLSASYFLLKDYDEAWAKAKKGKKLAQELDSKIQYRNSLDLLALISFHNKDLDDAEGFWKEAIKLGSSIAKYNVITAKFENILASADWKNEANKLGASENNAIVNSLKYQRPDFREIEKVKGKTLSDIAQDYLYNNKEIKTFSLKDNKAMIGKTRYEEGELIIFAKLDRGKLDKSYFFYNYPAEGKVVTSLNINNGNSTDEVTSKYGAPVNIISSGKHDFWVYFNKNIIFKINQDNKVDGYIIYDVNI